MQGGEIHLGMKYTKEEKRWIKSIAPKVWYKGKWIPKNKLPKSYFEKIFKKARKARKDEWKF